MKIKNFKNKKTDLIKSFLIVTIFFLMLLSTLFAATAISIQTFEEIGVKESVADIIKEGNTFFNKDLIQDNNQKEIELFPQVKPTIIVTAPETTGDTAVITIKAYDSLGNFPSGLTHIQVMRLEGTTYYPIQYKWCGGNKTCTLTFTETHNIPITHKYIVEVLTRSFSSATKMFTINYLGLTSAPTIIYHNITPEKPVTGDEIKIGFYVEDEENDETFIDYTILSDNYETQGTIECKENICELIINSSYVYNDDKFIVSAVPYDLKDRGKLYQFSILVGNYTLDVNPIEDINLNEDSQTSFSLDINYTGDFDYDISQLYLINSNQNIILSHNSTTINIQALNNWFGTETAIVEVCDELNKCDSEQFRINVAPVNDNPNVEIILPVEDSQYFVGEDIEFYGTATDNEEGNLNDVEWISNIDGIIGNEHQFILNNLSEGTHTITLTACDSQGLCGSDSIDFTIVEPYENIAPWIEPIIPNIGIETNGEYTLEINNYGHDLETKQDYLQWHVTGVDENLLSVDITQGVIFMKKLFGVIPLYNYDSSNIKFISQPGACGTDEVLITVMDEEGLTDSQWINVTIACDENNTPPWIEPVIPDINLEYEGEYNFILTSYGHDLETPRDMLEWGFVYNDSLISLELNNEKIITKPNGLEFRLYLMDDDNLKVVSQPGACGTDNILVTVYDEEGLSDYQYVGVNVECPQQQDNESPIVTITEPQNTTYYNSTIPINITATDNIAIDSIWYNIDGGANSTYTSETNITLPDGTYTLYAYANDTSGNIGTADVSFTINTTQPPQPNYYINIDLINPENGNITTIDTNNQTQTTAELDFVFNLTTNVSNLTCHLYLDNINTANLTNINPQQDTTTQYTFYNMSVENGTHYWNVSCGNGTITNTSDSWNFTLIINYTTNDITSPDITLTHPINHTILNYNENITFNYIVTDESNISNCSLYLNGTLNQTNSNIIVNATNSFIISYIPDGDYNWSVSCIDAFDNQGDSVVEYFTINTTQPPQPNYYINIDLINPENGNITTIDTNNQTQTTAEINFTYDITTNTTVNNCSLIIDSNIAGVDNNVSYDSVNEIPVVNYFNNISLTEGNHSWYVICNADNNITNVSDSWNFTLFINYIDNESPIVTITEPQNITYYNSTIPINITATDNVAIDSIWYEVDGTNYTFTNATTITLPDGTYTLIAYANDTSGNIGTANVSFTIDTSVAPSYGVDIYVCDADYQRIIDVSQIAEYLICINNTGNIQATFDLIVNNFNGATTANVNETPITVNAGEVYQVTLSVADDTEGEYNVSVTAVVNTNTTINDTTNITTTIVEEFTIINSTVNEIFYVLETTDLFNNINNTWIVNYSNIIGTSNFEEDILIINSYLDNSSAEGTSERKVDLLNINATKESKMIGSKVNDINADPCTIINSTIINSTITVNGTCFIKNMNGASSLINENYNVKNLYMSDGDPSNNNVTADTYITIGDFNIYNNNITGEIVIIEDSEVGYSNIDNTTINASLVLNSTITNSYIENSTLISLYVDNATILNNTIYNGTVCAIDMSWCFVADENNTMEINDTTQIPAVVLSANDNTIEEGENVQFTATASGLFNLSQNLTFGWDYGTGDTDITTSNTTTSITTYTYNNDGTFTATVKVEDSKGTYATDSVIITVNQESGSSGGGSSGGGSSGGGGGIVANQYYINFTEENPQTLSLMNYDTVLFDYNGERYSVIFTEFTEDKVVMRVKPIGKDLEFVVGTSRYLNLDDDLMNDIGITLEAFVSENNQRYAIVTYHSLALDRELNKGNQEEDEEEEDETPVEKILNGVVDIVGKLNSQTTLKKPDTKTGLIISGTVFVIGLLIFGVLKAITRKKEKMKF